MTKMITPRKVTPLHDERHATKVQLEGGAALQGKATPHRGAGHEAARH